MKKLLFIGNSHTYVNQMPQMVSELFRIYDDEEALPVMLTQGGMTLRWHGDQEQTHFNIRYGHYDFVVLQQATHPFDGEEALLRSAGWLLPEIRESGARPVAYMTWAQKSRPEDQAELTSAFTRLAREENTLLAPAGVIWERMRQQHPETELYAGDGAHASMTGSYLAAVSIYMAMTGKKALPFKEDAFYTDRKLDAALCREIHRLAGEVFSA